MKAVLKQYVHSPRKVRLVADLVRGKKVNQALSILEFLPKKAGKTISKLISSAAASTTHDTNNLFLKAITVDQGPILYRRSARSRGRGYRVRKRTSHVVVELAHK